MHIHFLDPYQERESLLHALDPRIKLVLAVAFIFTSGLMPVGAWPGYLLLLALVISAELLSELGIGFVLKRSALALPFVLAALPLLVTVQGATLFTLPLAGWAVTLPGLERFASVALKSWISVQAAILLASTTSFPDLLVAMRALRLPRLLVTVIGLMWRYMFVLADEALRLLRARSARSGAAAGEHSRVGGTLAWRARVTGGMAGNLFVRSFERSDRIYNAMVARGYDGEARTFPQPAVRRSQLALLGGIIAFFVLLLLTATIFWA